MFLRMCLRSCQDALLFMNSLNLHAIAQMNLALMTLYVLEYALYLLLTPFPFQHIYSTGAT